MHQIRSRDYYYTVLSRHFEVHTIETFNWSACRTSKVLLTLTVCSSFVPSHWYHLRVEFLQVMFKGYILYFSASHGHWSTAFPRETYMSLNRNGHWPFGGNFGTIRISCFHDSRNMIFSCNPGLINCLSRAAFCMFDVGSSPPCRGKVVSVQSSNNHPFRHTSLFFAAAASIYFCRIDSNLPTLVGSPAVISIASVMPPIIVHIVHRSGQG